VIEPIQSEAGIRVPPADYLRAAQCIVQKVRHAFVLDEVRTRATPNRPFWQRIIGGLNPRHVVLAKALSGGLVPAAAVLMSDDIYERFIASLGRSIIHT